MKVELLVFANSIKPGGRCLAGIDVATGKWIRPVSTAPGREIPNSLACINGYWIGPGDLIEIELGSAVPLPHHPEDHELKGQLRLVKKNAILDYAELVLTELMKPNELLEHSNHKIPIAQVTNQPILNSLALVFGRDVIFFTDYRPSKRVKFQTEGQSWFLSQTDDKRTSLDPLTSGLICISLADPFQRTQSHHKLAAGIIEIAEQDLIDAAAARERKDDKAAPEHLPLVDAVRPFVYSTVNIEDDNRLKDRVWFWQAKVPLRCLECNALLLEVFRSHEGPKPGTDRLAIHRYALLCQSRNYIFTTPLTDDAFRKNLAEECDRINPVKQVCNRCV